MHNGVLADSEKGLKASERSAYKKYETRVKRSSIACFKTTTEKRIVPDQISRTKLLEDHEAMSKSL
jgi:hypothetical protein